MDNFNNRILWWTLVVSLLIYVVVAHVVQIRTEGSDDFITTLALALGLVSVGTAAGTIWYRRHALAGPIQRGEVDLSQPEGQGQAFTPFILNLVLSESVGIYGLVLTFLSGNPSYSILFVVGALALMYVHRPTAPDLQPPPSAGFSGGRPDAIA